MNCIKKICEICLIDESCHKCNFCLKDICIRCETLLCGHKQMCINCEKSNYCEVCEKEDEAWMQEIWDDYVNELEEAYWDQTNGF